MKKIGLYFGSFNPIHVGHLIIASSIIQAIDLHKIWFIVSPQNPLKKSNSLLNEYHRLHLVRIAIEDDNRFRVKDVEFKMPVPSYTIDTLTYLQEMHPNTEFKVIMGSDSFQNITKWKNYDLLLKKYGILVYNRPGFEVTSNIHKILIIKEVPLIEISSTAIRKMIFNRKSARYFLPDKVWEEIEKSGYYRV